MDVRCYSGEVSNRNEEHIIRNWRRGNSYYKVAKNLTELCSSVFGKVDLVSDEIEYSSEEISGQSLEEVAWFLITAPSKTHQEKDKLKTKLLSKKKSELRDLETSQPIHIWKSESLFWRNSKGAAEQPFEEEIIGVILT